MSTSLFRGLVRSQASQWGSYAPADAAWSRAIMSNVMHSADSCGQVLVNWRTADFATQCASRTLTQASTWYAVWASAPLPIRLRGDGTAYPLRIRLRAARGVAGTVDLAVVVLGGRLTVDAGYDAISVGAPLSTTASTAVDTFAWLTLSAPTITLASGSASTTEIERSTRAAIGGAAVGVRYDAARVAVFARRGAGSGASTTALVNGLHAAEYIGA